VCGLKPAVYQLTRGTFRKYKDVCEDCLWPEMRKKGVKLKIDFPPGAWDEDC